MAGSGLATVMFTDLVGSTRMRDRLGDDVADGIGVEHDRIIGDALSTTGGRLVKNLGDGALAVFDSSVDAVMAGQRIQEGITLYNRQANADHRIQVRIGINAGEVAHEDGDVIGLPVAVASRVCDKADGGQILITDTVKALIGRRARFPYLSVGSHSLKGVDDPVELWSIEEATQPAEAVEGDVPFPAFLARGIPNHLIGRDMQLTKLSEAHNAATEGTSLIAIIGEPGIGKTSFTSTWCRIAADQGATVVAGRCTPDAALPYQPFIEIARSILDAQPEKLISIGPAAGNVAQLVPGISLPPNLPPPLQTDADTTQYLMAEAFGTLMRSAPGAPATIAVLDDLHWADEQSIATLAHLARKDEGLPLVIVGTYRDTDLVRTHPLPTLLTDLRREHRVKRIPLPRLTEAEVGSMIDSFFGTGIAMDIIESISEETQGNPFFIQEITTHLQDEGAIDQTGTWVSDIPIDDYGIPEGVREVVGRRLESLGGDAVATLEVAAVIGPTFSIDVAGAVAGLDERSIDAVIETATAARIIIEGDDADEFAFAHALLRQTLYDDLPTRRRIRLHRAVAETLETRDEPAKVLLNHWIHANENDRALKCAVEAAEAAVRSFAHAEGSANLSLAIELWDDATDPQAATGLDHADLVIRLAQATSGFGGDQQGSIDRITQELERLDLDDHIRALLYNEMSAGLTVQGNRDEALEIGVKALEFVPKDQPNTTWAEVLSGLAGMLMLDGQFSEGQKKGQKALELAIATGNVPAELRALSTLATIAGDRNDLDTSRKLFDQLAERAQDTGSLRAELLRYVNWGSVLGVAGKHNEAIEVTQQGIARAHELGVTSWERMLRGNAAEILFDTTAWSDASVHLTALEPATTVDQPQINVSVQSMIFAAEQGDQGTMQTEMDRLSGIKAAAMIAQLSEPYFASLISNYRWQARYGAAVEATLSLLAVERANESGTQLERIASLGIETIADAVNEGDEAEGWVELAAVWQKVTEASRERRTHQSAEFNAVSSANLARVKGRNDPGLWREAVDAWEDHPYYGAKAQWRLAQALIESDAYDAEAVEFLDSAQEVAQGLKAQPLLAAIEATREKPPSRTRSCYLSEAAPGGGQRLFVIDEPLPR